MGIMFKKTRGTGVLVIVLVLVNGIAIWGQAGWAHEHVAPQMIPADFPGNAIALQVTALLLAAALELTGVYLSIMADEAERNGQPAGGLRLASYACGLLSGGLNFSHWTGAAAKISLGFLSAISPFLWGVYSRVRRGETAAPSRRLWHPFKSVSLIREMAWEGISSEEEAISRRSNAETLRLPRGFSSAPAWLPVEHGAEMLLLPAPQETPPQEKEMLLPETPEEIRPISAAPVSPAALRAPRALRSSWDAAKVIDMILEGREKAEIFSVTGISPTSYGRISKVLRVLRADRGAAIDYRSEKVSEEHVDMMRKALAR